MLVGQLGSPYPPRFISGFSWADQLKPSSQKPRPGSPKMAGGPIGQTRFVTLQLIVGNFCLFQKLPR
jgi:hypothetical protein